MNILEIVTTIKVISAARKIQTYLWGEANDKYYGLEEWKRMFRKRVAKIEAIKPGNPHAAIEMKKRLLQTAALAIWMMVKIDRYGIPAEQPSDLPSNLPQYATPVEDR